MNCRTVISAFAFIGFWAATPGMAQLSLPKSFNPPKISAPKTSGFTPPKISPPKTNFNPPKISPPKTNFNPPKISPPKTNFNPPKISPPKININPPKVSGTKLPPLNPPKVNIPKPDVKIPNPFGGNSSPGFAGTPGTKKPTTTKPSGGKGPRVIDPSGPNITFDYDTATSTTKPKPPKPPVVNNTNPGTVKQPPRVDPGVKILTDVLGGLSNLPPPSQGYPLPPIQVDPRPTVVVRPQPQPQPQPPTYVPTQPRMSPTLTPVPRNTVVTEKKLPLNPLSNPVEFNLDTTQAETDARQEVEAAQAVSMLDTHIIEDIKNMPDGPQKEELLKAWQDVVRGGGKTEDVHAFLEKYGPNGNMTIPAETLGYLDMRQDLSTYADNLRKGAFTTSEERDQALADLQTSLSAFNQGKNDKYAATLQEKLTNMQNYNTLGKLAVAVQESENPYPILVQGATQADMPLALVSEMTGYPVMGVQPVSEQTMPVAASEAPATIMLHNPNNNGAGVGYLLAGYQYSMQPGEDQVLDRQYVLSFDPGNGTQKQYTLGTGYYEWRVDPQTGWDISKKKVALVIDNSRYDGVFEYLVNGELVRLGPGEIAEHSSDTPIEVAFHSGREGLEHRKLLKPGRYLVGLDPTMGALDLFAADKVEAFEVNQPAHVASTTIGGSHATKAQRVQALLAQLKKPGEPATGKGVTPPGATAKKSVSPLGKKTPSASPADLLKSIKSKAASSETNDPLQKNKGQLPITDFPERDSAQIPTVTVPSAQRSGVDLLRD
jgi:hypothetical protein